MKVSEKTVQTPLNADSFFKALREGTLEDIPAELRPEITDYERKFTCVKLLRMLRKADPEYKKPQTINYLTLLARRAIRLLHIACDFLLHGDRIVDADPSEASFLYSLAANENLLPIAHTALGQTDNNDAIKKVRQFILMQDAWKRIKNAISANDDAPKLIPLFPSEVTALYKEPWLRCGNSLSFLTDGKMIEPLKELMTGHGFSIEPTDPLEDERLRCIRFSKDEYSFSVFFDTPFVLHGECGDYLSDCFRRLLNEGREMSMPEYAVLLAIKLHIPNMHPSSASLLDLLDLILILNANPSLATADDFIDRLSELKIEDSWKSIYSIYKKALSVSDEVSLQDDELKYLIELIGMPFLRTSYIEKFSMSLMKENSYLDPPEYAVSHEKRLVYLVNSKVACSSIKASMLDDEVPDDYTVHRTVFLQGMTARELQDEEQDYFKFTFVRNPFARLVSCYKSKYHTDLERYRKKFDFRDYLNGYLYKDEGFDEFVRKVCALPYRLMDRHFRSQYDLIYNAAGNHFDYIGHFKSLNDEFLSIQIKNRLRPLPHLNKVGTDDWMQYYTPETAALVYRTFRKDIETFGYEDCYRNLLASFN